MRKALLMLGVAAMHSVSVIPAHAQKAKAPPPDLGWDLSYRTLLERNGVGPGEHLHRWLAERRRSSAEKLIAGWEGGPVVSSILIDAPGPDYVENGTVWFVRTKRKAHMTWLNGGAPAAQPYAGSEVSTQFYDGLLKEMSGWRQAVPRDGAPKAPGGYGVYVGFLSLYEGGRSRQMLLAAEDLCVESKGEKCLTPGRLIKLLMPLFMVRW